MSAVNASTVFRFFYLLKTNVKENEMEEKPERFYNCDKTAFSRDCNEMGEYSSLRFPNRNGFGGLPGSEFLTLLFGVILWTVGREIVMGG